MLGRGHVHRQRRSKRREEDDLEFECLLDSRAPREAEDPVLVGDRDLEVVAVVDLDDRRRAAAERACDQPPAVVVTRLQSYET